MTKVTLEEITKVLTTAVLINTLFTFFLLSWVTKNDISGLPDDLGERFIHLFYFSVVSFTTTGYGDITPKSSRLKIVLTLYLLLVIAGAFSFFFNF